MELIYPNPKQYFSNYRRHIIINSFNNHEYKHIYLSRPKSFYKHIIPDLYDILSKYDYTTKWCDKIYDKVYLNRQKIYSDTLLKLNKYASIMNNNDIHYFEHYNGNIYNQPKKLIEGFIDTRFLEIIIKENTE